MFLGLKINTSSPGQRVDNYLAKKGTWKTHCSVQYILGVESKSPDSTGQQ